MKKLFISLMLTAGLVACESYTSNQNSSPTSWELFRGDAGLSGYTKRTLPKQPVLKWSFKSDVRTVSSPVVSDGVTYWSDRRGVVRGVDATGTLVFTYDLQTAVEATPLIHDSVLYIGRIDGMMTALSLSQKDTLWTFESFGQIVGSPNLIDGADGKRIVFGSYDNFLYCLDANTGKLLSQYETGYYVNGTPALLDKYVIAGGCDSWLRVIDCEQGIQTDSLQTVGYIASSPAIVGKECYVGDYSGTIYHIELEEGKITQHKELVEGDSKGGSFVSIPAVSKDRCYHYTKSRYLTAVNREDGSLAWEYLLKGDTGESSPLICNNKIIACTKSGIIVILDAATGKLIWEYDAGEQIVGSPAVIEGNFLILTTKGTLLCFGEAAIKQY